MAGRRDGWYACSPSAYAGLGVPGEIDAGRLVLDADAEAHQPVDRLGQRIERIEEAPRAVGRHIGGQQPHQQHTDDAAVRT